jgi:hypothetical protein
MFLSICRKDLSDNIVFSNILQETQLESVLPCDGVAEQQEDEDDGQEDSSEEAETAGLLT